MNLTECQWWFVAGLATGVVAGGVIAFFAFMAALSAAAELNRLGGDRPSDTPPAGR